MNFVAIGMHRNVTFAQHFLPKEGKDGPQNKKTFHQL